MKNVNMKKVKMKNVKDGDVKTHRPRRLKRKTEGISQDRLRFPKILTKSLKQKVGKIIKKWITNIKDK